MEDVKIEKKDGVVSMTITEKERSITFSFSSFVTVKGDTRACLTVAPTVKGEQLVPFDLRVSLNESREAYVRQIVAAYGKKYQDPTLHLSVVFGKFKEYMAEEEVKNVLILADVEPKVPSYLVEPFVESGVPNILFAPGGLGKTTLAHRIIASVVSGEPLFGHAIKEEDVGNVLILDWENSAETSSMILHKVCNDIPNLTMEMRRRVRYVSLLLPLVDIVDQMAEVVRRHDIKFIVLDSGTPAVGGAPEAADLVSLLYSAIRSIGVTSLIIAHVAKADTENKSAIGSVFWTNFARNAFSIEEVKAMSRNSTLIRAKHKKHNSGEKVDDIYYTMTHGKASVSFTLQENVVPPTAKEVITALLTEHGRLTRADMKSLSSLSGEEIRKTTNRMKEDGTATSNDKGKTWELT